MTFPARVVATPLKQVLTEHLEILQTLLATLEQERGALHENQVETLERLTAEKSTAAARLRDLGLQLDKLRIAAGNEPMDRWLSRMPETAADWRRVLDIGAQCQTANRENAARLDARMRQTRGRLQVLRGDQVAPLYGSAGPVAAYSQRLLGQA